MSGRVEKLLKAYPEMIQKRDCLAYQLAHFKGLSAEDVIDSMLMATLNNSIKKHTMARNLCLFTDL